MMDKMKTVLKELEIFLSESDCPLLTHFQGGISASEVADTFSNLKFPIRDDIKQLYEWKNGVSDLFKKKTGEIELFSSGIMMPLELATSMYVLEVKVQKSFKKEFFPLFTSGGGDYILIHLDESKKTYGQLFLYSPAILLSSKPMTIYDSLTTLFQTILNIYQRGGYFFSKSDKSLEIDYDIEKEISIKLNSKSDFWREN
ncbi:SMI1/KNR4 family protein [Terrimonas rubra]|uniref:SMI1/KNR4 family protein n=1 Tax=Terrimonas rubra TaxID=1035890 RepID=A0ABW6A4G2_9BACT